MPSPAPRDSYTSLITWPPAPFLSLDWLLPSIALLWWFSLSPASLKRVSTGGLGPHRSVESKSGEIRQWFEVPSCGHGYSKYHHFLGQALCRMLGQHCCADVSEQSHGVDTVRHLGHCWRDEYREAKKVSPGNTALPDSAAMEHTAWS